MQLKSDIAQKNDSFRRNFLGGRVMLSRGVLSSSNRKEIIDAAKRFDQFTKDNDPYGEHDCASFLVAGTRYLFKIDYYDKNFEFGVEPDDPECRRVLTIMRSDEY